MRLRTFPLVLVVVAGISSVTASSHAQDKDAVEALFTEGKTLMAAGKFPQACPKFLASYGIEKRLGTLLNLADCYEKNGQLASAWARYVEAKPMAEKAAQQERLTFASERIAALEPKLARLTLVVPPNIPGLVVKRDGVVVDPASFGTELPVDVGAHVISASAPHRQPWSTKAVIARDGDKQTVSVPALFTWAADQPNPDEPNAADVPPPPQEHAGTSGRTIASFVLGGVGIAALGVGAGFGASALSKKSDSDPYCGQNGAAKNDCTSDGVTLRSDAVSRGNISTVFLASGVALIASGLVLWLTAPKKTDATAYLERGFVF